MIDNALQYTIEVDDTPAQEGVARTNKAFDSVTDKAKSAASQSDIAFTSMTASIVAGAGLVERAFSTGATAAGSLTASIFKGVEAVAAIGAGITILTASIIQHLGVTAAATSATDGFVNSLRALRVAASALLPETFGPLGWAVETVSAGIVIEIAAQIANARALMIEQQAVFASAHKLNFDTVSTVDAGTRFGGSDQGGVRDLLVALDKRIDNNQKDVRSGLTTLGISPMEGLPKEDVKPELLTEIAKGLLAIKDPAERADEAFKIFGEDGARALDVLNRSFIDGAESARRFGSMLDGETRIAVDQFHQNLLSIKDFFTDFSWLHAFGDRLSQEIAGWTAKVGNFVVELDKFFYGNAGRAIAGGAEFIYGDTVRANERSYQIAGGAVANVVQSADRAIYNNVPGVPMLSAAFHGQYDLFGDRSELDARLGGATMYSDPGSAADLKRLGIAPSKDGRYYTLQPGLGLELRDKAVAGGDLQNAAAFRDEARAELARESSGKDALEGQLSHAREIKAEAQKKLDATARGTLPMSVADTLAVSSAYVTTSREVTALENQLDQLKNATEAENKTFEARKASRELVYRSFASPDTGRDIRGEIEKMTTFTTTDREGRVHEERLRLDDETRRNLETAFRVFTLDLARKNATAELKIEEEKIQKREQYEEKLFEKRLEYSIKIGEMEVATDDRALSHQRELLAYSRDEQLGALAGTRPQTVQGKLALEQRKLGIETDYITQNSVQESEGLDRQKSRELQDLAGKRYLNQIDDQTYFSGREAITRKYGEQGAELNDKFSHELITAQQQAATASVEIVRSAQEKEFSSLKTSVEGVLTAMESKSESVFSAIGKSLKAALLGALNEIVSSQIAAALFRVLNPGATVGFDGSVGHGKMGGFLGGLGLGTQPVFGGSVTPLQREDDFRQSPGGIPEFTLGASVFQSALGAGKDIAAETYSYSDIQTLARQSPVIANALKAMGKYNGPAVFYRDSKSARDPITQAHERFHAGQILATEGNYKPLPEAEFGKIFNIDPSKFEDMKRGRGGEDVYQMEFPAYEFDNPPGSQDHQAQLQQEFGAYYKALKTKYPDTAYRLLENAPKYLQQDFAPDAGNSIIPAGLKRSDSGIDYDAYSDTDLPASSMVNPALFPALSGLGGGGSFVSGGEVLGMPSHMGIPGIGGLGGILGGGGSGSGGGGLGGILGATSGKGLLSGLFGSGTKDGGFNQLLGGAFHPGNTVGLAGNLSQLGHSSAALMGGGLLLTDGLKRGGFTGTLEDTAGGALMGFKFGGPIGAAIGAGIGLGVGLLREFVFGGDRQHAKDLVKQVYGMSIDDKMADQIVQLAKQSYGGQVEVAVRSQQVRDLLKLYAEANGSSAQKQFVADQVHSASLIEAGGKLTQGAFYDNGQAYTYASGLPTLDGISSSNLPTSGRNAGQSINVQHLQLQLNGQSASDALAGQVTRVATPSYIQNNSIAAQQSSIGRSSATTMALAPSAIVQ